MKRFSKIVINIIVYISIAMILLAILMGAILNGIIEKQYLKQVQTNNQMLFKQLAYHVEYIHKTNLAFLNMEFNDSNIQSLLTATENKDMFPYIQVFNQIVKDMSANEMIDSVMLYNGTLDYYYSTDTLPESDRVEIVEALDADKEGGLIKISSRTIHTIQEHEVLSYTMMTRNLKDNSVESAIVVNVKKEKILEELQNPNSEKIMLSDSKGNVILSTDKKQSGKLEKEIARHLNDSRESIFIEHINGEKQVINIQEVEGTECLLVVTQPYKLTFGILNEIQNQIIFAVVLTLGITLVLTIIVVGKLMEPFSSLMLRVKKMYGGGEKQKEVALLSEVLERQRTQLDQYGDYKQRTEDLLHKMRMKNILLENGTNMYPPRKIEDMAEYNVFQKGEKVYVALLTIAGFQKLSKEEMAERNLVRFSVCNIANELMEQYGRVEILPVSSGDVVLLLGREEHDRKLCRSLLWEVEENVRKVVDVTLSAFIDEITYDREELPLVYRNLQKMSKYTLVYGIGCIVFASEIEGEERQNLQYPQEIETEIINAVNEGKTEQIEALLKQFLDYLKMGSIESYILQVHRLVLAIQAYVDHINQHRLIKIQAGFGGGLLEDMESEEQVYQMLSNLVREIMVQMPSNVNKKNEAMVQKIQDYINANYAKKELCSKSVAAEFGLSTGYVGMLFKESTGNSIQEYINRIRLEHAGELVLHTDLLISEIMEKCGFETSSFYRLYKNYFGTSPKEHRMKQKLEEKK